MFYGQNATIFFFLTLIVVIQTQKSYASHIIGGEITYTCVGGNNFDLHLDLYRDCNSGTGFDNPLYITVFNDAGMVLKTENMGGPSITTLDWTEGVEGICLINGVTVCVQQGAYNKSNVALTGSAGKYTISYQRCCRNSGVVNIVNPGSTGSTYTIEIPTFSPGACDNSSPVFNNYPPMVLCAGSPYIFDHSATDIDGDSLVYDFCTPFIGASLGMPAPMTASAPPYTPVTWATGYSQSYQLASTPPMTIDGATGSLVAYPNAIGRFLVGICATEYRNGIPLSSNIREFQFNVGDCVIVAASISDTSGTVILPSDTTICLGESFQLNAIAQSGYDYEWSPPDGLSDPYIVNPIATPTTTTTYVFTSTDPSGTCDNSDTITINVVSLPPGINGTQSICQNDPLPPLITTPSDPLNTISWYNSNPNNGSPTLLAIGDTIFGFEYAAVADSSMPGNYAIWFEETNYINCQATPATITLTVNPNPNAPSANNPPPICQNDALPTLTASGSGGTLNWYDADPTAGSANLLGTGTNLSGSQYSSIADNTTPGTYTVWVHEESVFGCFGFAAKAVDIVVLPRPNAPIASNPAPICQNDPLPSLNASSLTNGTLNWYGNVSLTNLLGSGNSLPGNLYASVADSTTAGTYTIWVQENLNGCTGLATAVYIIVNPNPPAPTSPPQTICFAQPLPDFTATGNGGTITWFDADPGQGTANSLGTGNVISGSQYNMVANNNIAGTYTLYFQEASGLGCLSSVSSTTLTVNPVPPAPTGNNANICQGQPLPDLTGTGNYGNLLTWYDVDPNFGTGLILGMGTTLPGSAYTSVADNNTPGIYTVWLQESYNNCPSYSTPVQIEVKPLPAAPLGNNIAICLNDTLPDLTASGTSGILTWYDADPNLTTPTVLGIGDTLPAANYATIANPAIAGTYTVWVQEEINSCKGISTPVILTVKAQTPAPTVANVTLCANSLLPDLSATGSGGSFTWYNADPNFGTPTILGSGAVLTGAAYSSVANNTLPGVYWVYVQETVNGCNSLVASVSITVEVLPPAPTASPVFLCAGAAIPDITPANTGGILT